MAREEAGRNRPCTQQLVGLPANSKSPTLSAAPSMSDAPDLVSISTDPDLLDVPWICAAMRSLPGGEALVDGQIRQALHGSLVFGAYCDGRQVGFVRVVTDGAIFSSVCDTYVDEAHRNKGVGSALLKAVVEHPSVAGTRCILQARQPLWLWYFRHGDFHVVDKLHGIMVRVGR